MTALVKSISTTLITGLTWSIQLPLERQTANAEKRNIISWFDFQTLGIQHEVAWRCVTSLARTAVHKKSFPYMAASFDSHFLTLSSYLSWTKVKAVVGPALLRQPDEIIGLCTLRFIGQRHCVAVVFTLLPPASTKPVSLVYTPSYADAASAAVNRRWWTPNKKCVWSCVLSIQP